MNKHSYVLGLMTIVALTGCGKSLKITPQGQSAVTQTKTAFSKRQTREAAAKLAAQLAARHASVVSLQNTSGELTVLSDLDVTQMSGQLPYVDQADPFQDIGNPSSSVKNKGQAKTASSSDGFISQSNLVFRAVVKLPPEANKSAITSVNAITLKLRGVTLTTGGNASDASLSDQALCFFETKTCVGKLQSTVASNLNQSYSSLQTSPLSEGANFEAIHSISQDDLSELKVFSYTGAAKAGPTELDLDLKAVLGLSQTSDAIAWLYKNSIEFDTQSNFRKFRFAFGNSVYAAEGELVVDVTTDQTLLPKTGDTSAVTAKSASDATRTIVSSVASATEVNDVIEVADEGVFALDSTEAALTSNSVTQLTALANVLTAQAASIKELDLIIKYDLSNTTGEDKAAAGKLAKAISDELITLKVPRTIHIIQGFHQAIQSSCGSTLACPADRGTEFRIKLNDNLLTDDKSSIKSGLKTSLDGIFNGDSSAVPVVPATPATPPASATTVAPATAAASDQTDCN